MYLTQTRKTRLSLIVFSRVAKVSSAVAVPAQPELVLLVVTSIDSWQGHVCEAEPPGMQVRETQNILTKTSNK